MTSILIGMTSVAVLTAVETKVKSRWITGAEITILTGVGISLVIKLIEETKAVFAF